MSTPKIFRVTFEVANLDAASAFYADLLGTPGQRHPGARHYFDCGGVILALIDVSQGGRPPSPGPKSLYLASDEVDAVHARAKKLGQAGAVFGARLARRRFAQAAVGRTFRSTSPTSGGTSCASSKKAPCSPDR